MYKEYGAFGKKDLFWRSCYIDIKDFERYDVSADIRKDSLVEYLT